MKMYNRNQAYSLLIIAFILIFANSCKKDEDNKPVPILTTSSVSDISQNSATCGGNIRSDEGATITARGVCWSTGQTPTITDSKTINGIGAGRFISAITGLTPNTTYYVRAYATNNAGTGYGSTMAFSTGTVSDIDGNVYHTVTIGTQVWMVENLNVAHYRNGDAIPNVTDATVWSHLSTGAYCNNDNSAGNGAIYGKLYNFFTVVDMRKLCPTDWHVPSDDEWTTLTSFLEGDSLAGGKLKETGTAHWLTPNLEATNETGFTALPGSMRFYSGGFIAVGYSGYWWSTDLDSYYFGLYRNIDYNSGKLWSSSSYKNTAYSVRCLRDY